MFATNTQKPRKLYQRRYCFLVCIRVFASALYQPSVSSAVIAWLNRRLQRSRSGSRRDGAALLTQPTSYRLHWPGVSGNDTCQLRQLSKPVRGPNLSKSDKKVCKYDGPEHQHANVPAEVEGKTGAKHEQHQAQERFPLFPPTDRADQSKGP